MTTIFGKRTKETAKKKADLHAKEKELRKADRERYQRKEEIRRKKIIARLFELALKYDGVRLMIEVTVEQLRKERGGKIFDGWVVPGRPDSAATPNAREIRQIADMTDVSGNQQTEPTDQLEAHPDDAKKAAVQDPVPDDKRAADTRILWEAKFAKRPGPAILADIKQRGGRWNKVPGTWSGEVPGRQLSEVRHIVESAGGEFSILLDEPAARAP